MRLREYYAELSVLDGDGPAPRELMAIGWENKIARANEYVRLVEEELGGPSPWLWHQGLPRIVDPRLATA